MQLDSLSFTGKDYTLMLSENIPIEMVQVEPGMFTMGKRDEKNDEDEKEHSVTLNNAFWIGKTEVTQAQWKAVMGNNPSNFKGDNLPVETVSWDDCKAFCAELNKLYARKLPSGYQFDLPTEAQWEYAARGGNKSRGYKYSGSNDINKVAWYDGNSDSKMHPVGEKAPNELGLYDMSGNVWEWCRDYYEGGYAQDPEFLSGNRVADRVLRGGSYEGSARYCRSSYREYYTPTYRDDDLGFRLALVRVQQSGDDSAGNNVKSRKSLSNVWMLIFIICVFIGKFAGIWLEKWFKTSMMRDEEESKVWEKVHRRPKQLKYNPKRFERRLEGWSKTVDSVRYFSKKFTLPGNIPFVMVLVKPGTFTVGKRDSESWDNEKEHSVTLKNAFWIGKTEVTQAQWKAVMGNNPSNFKGDNLPVENVSWNKCKEFCDKLNKLYAGKLPSGYQFDLPTEAQWEYAALGGNKSQRYKYRRSNDIGNVAWYAGNSNSKTHPVGEKAPNELGLYDMSGNVWEWCRDRYEEGYASDPEFLSGNRGADRVLRGGSWNGSAGGCRSSFRNRVDPTYRFSNLGLRLALVRVQ